MGKKWFYEGFTVGGQVTSGEVQADSREQVAEMMRGKNVYLQQIREVGVEKIQPVLPKGKTSFEEELGFIETKKPEPPPPETPTPPAPEVKPEVEPEAEEPVPTNSELEEWVNNVREAREEIIAESKVKLQDTQKEDPVSKTPKEEKSSCCAGSCCGCGSETPCVEGANPNSDDMLDQDLMNLTMGMEKVVRYFVNYSQAKDEKQIEVILEQAKDVANKVLERALYDYVQRQRR